MGTTPFPPALYPCILAEGYSGMDEDDVTRQEASDLSVLKLYNGTRWRASFTLRTRTGAERAAFIAFKGARFGGFDSFPFTAPDDQVTRQVCFETVSEAHVSGGVWDYQVALVEEL